MKKLITLALALSLSGSLAFAAPPPPSPQGGSSGGQQGQQPHDGQDRGRDRDNRQQGQQRSTPRWSRGDRLPDQDRRNGHQVQDWRRNNLPKPAKGYHWICYDRSNCFLVADRNGAISRTWWRDERNDFWRRRYARVYTYQDDLYYRECRQRPDPAGILIGGLIGGLIGHSVGEDGAGDTFAGIIIGSAIGAALTKDLDCDDRSYAYRTYYDGLNSGRPGYYRWRNPHNNHHGDFYVSGYYDDADGFRCARYTHTVFLDRRREASGRACRQPDGAWLFVN
jgi:Ni/Co efflux regulator RcnB/surface antigen